MPQQAIGVSKRVTTDLLVALCEFVLVVQHLLLAAFAVDDLWHITMSRNLSLHLLPYVQSILKMRLAVD
jgi:hypothetical protein